MTDHSTGAPACEPQPIHVATAERPSGAPLPLLPAMPAQPHPLESPAPSRRIVPALIDGAPLYVDCPAWCVLDHVAENEGALEDLFHAGDQAELFVPHPGDAGPQLLVTVRLNEDPFLLRRGDRGSSVCVDAGADPFMLSAREANEFADDLVAFAARVRAAARILAAEAQK